MSDTINGGYTRRRELTCTEAELTQYGSKILLQDEALYVKKADGTRTVRFGDGVTSVKNLPVSIDYGAVKSEADRATTQANKAAEQVTKAQEQAGKAAVSAEQAAQAANYWTPTESIRELGHLRECAGKSLDITDTISGPAPSLTLFGDTRIMPSNRTLPVSPDNPQEIITAGGLCEWDGVLEQGGMNNDGSLSPTDSPNRVRTKYIKVSPDSLYKIKLESSKPGIVTNIKEFTADKTYIRDVCGWESSGITFRTGNKAQYIRFAIKATSEVNITPSEVTASICPVLRYLKTSGNMLRNGYGNENTVYTGGTVATYTGDGYTKITNVASGNQGVYIYGPDKNATYIRPNTKYTIIAEVEKNTLSQTFEINMDGGNASSYTPFPKMEVPAKWTGKVAFNMTTYPTVATTSMLYSRCGMGGNDGEYILVRVMMFPTAEPEDTPYQVGEIDLIDVPLMDETGNALQPLTDMSEQLGLKDQIINDGVWKVHREVYSPTYAKLGTPNILRDKADKKCLYMIYNFIDHKILMGAAKVLSNCIPTKVIGSEDAMYDEEFVTGHGTEAWSIKFSIDKSRLSKYNYSFNMTTTQKQEVVRQWCEDNGVIFYCPGNVNTYETLHADAQSALNKLASTYAGRTIITSADPLPPTLQMTVGVQPDKATYSRPEAEQSFSNALVREAESDLINIHTAPAPAIELELTGKSEQDTTAGKNLCPVNGIKVPVAKDVSIVTIDLKAGAYTLSYTLSNASSTSVRNTPCLSPKAEGGTTYRQSTAANYNNTNGTKTWTVEIAVAGSYNLFWWGVDTTTEQALSNIQLETGSTVTAYEPYTGGIPSPNPDYPQPVRSVGGEIEWDGVLEQGSINSTGLAPNEKEVRSMSYISVTPSSSYRIKANGVDWCNVTEYDKDRNFITNHRAGWDTLPHTFTTTPVTRYIKIRFGREPYITITPSDVTGVTICPVISVYHSGKNLLPAGFAKSVTTNGITFKVNPDGSVDVSGTATDTAFLSLTGVGGVPVKKGCVYAVPSWPETLSESSGAYLLAQGYKGNTWLWGLAVHSGTDGKIDVNKINSSTENVRLAIYVKKGSSANLRVYPQMELADSATVYFPPSGETVSIPLMDTHGDALEPLRGIPRLNADRAGGYDSIGLGSDGLWRIHRTIELFDFDQVQRAEKSYVADRYTMFQTNDLTRVSRTNMMSNLLSITMERHDKMERPISCISLNGDYSWVNCNMIVADNITGITTSDTNTEKILKLREWAKSSGLKIYYVSPVTSETILCDEAQTALNKLAQMYPNQTVITGVDAVSPGFKIKYAADSNYIIEQLTNAVIALGGQI